jgi:hypothetical protein
MPAAVSAATRMIVPAVDVPPAAARSPVRSVAVVTGSA